MRTTTSAPAVELARSLADDLIRPMAEEIDLVQAQTGPVREATLQLLRETGA